MFAKQAKDQSRKYEEYLEGANELLTFSHEFSSRMIDMLDLVLDRLCCRNPCNLEDFWGFGIDEVAPLKIVDRFEASEFLKRKKLFLNPRSFILTKDKLKLPILQEKVNRVLHLVQSNVSAGTKHASADVDEADIGAEEQSETSLFARESLETKDDSINAQIVRTARGAEQLVPLLNRQTGQTIDNELLRKLMKTLREVTDGALIYYKKVKGDILQSLEMAGHLTGPDNATKGPSDEILELRQRVLEAEKLEYAKLLELREENSKLGIIQNHIKKQDKKFVLREWQDRQKNSKERI